MKKMFTERDAEERLHRLPRLRLDEKRRNEILQRTLSRAYHSDSSNRGGLRGLEGRRPWGSIMAAITVLIAVVGTLVYASGKLGTGPIHNRGDQTSASATSKPNEWLTDSQKRTLIAQGVANMFNGQPPPLKNPAGLNTKQNVPIISTSATQDSTGQKTYKIKMKGKFTYNHQQAAYLSFMTSVDGSKVWDIRATTSSEKTKWTMKRHLNPQVKQFVYSGGNKDWTGIYRQANVQIWWKNSTTQETQLGSSDTSKGMVWYTGSGPVPNVSAYSVNVGGVNLTSSSGTGGLSILQGKPQFSLPGLGMVTMSDNIHISITANGHKEAFLLRDVAQKNAKPIPMMKIVSIQPQEGGVLIHVQGKPHPVNVAIDSKQTQDSSGAKGTTGAKSPQATFIIRDAKPVNNSVTNFTKFNQGGNQFIRSISVKPQGSNLLVQLKLNQGVNTLDARASGRYIGVALQNRPSGIPKFFEHPHTIGALPGWFVTDMELAATYEGTPMKPVTYGQMLPHKASGKYLLAAPLDANANQGESVTYTSYFGAIRLFDTAKEFISGESSVPASKVRTGYVKEVANGKTTDVKATLLDMGNGWGFGFAKNQVIVYSQHGGFYTYTVYPVPDVILG